MGQVVSRLDVLPPPVKVKRASRNGYSVVSRGGRPDLAGDHLAFVEAPTLLLVGGRDEQVIELGAEEKPR
ncbi:hypothetical protein DFO68_101246 [Halomonas ventosae]|uniref:Uncharacterized protein n=1 Tax=Halomonas ventosae TaxID=229007 RepID=A0A4R6I7G8_9GAMM|nr:hypothetical protein DFO68_101246 [Halomonas ventosae]